MKLSERSSQELQRGAFSLLYLKKLKTSAPKLTEKDSYAISGDFGNIYGIFGALIGAHGMTDR